MDLIGDKVGRFAAAMRCGMTAGGGGDSPLMARVGTFATVWFWLMIWDCGHSWWQAVMTAPAPIP